MVAPKVKHRQVKALELLVLIIVALFLGRLILLQVVDGSYYRTLADENRVKLTIQPADRGVIYDRHGEVLARNAPSGREYVLGPAAAHVLGYVATVSQEQWITCRQSSDCDYWFGETIGQLGLESFYDDKLRGDAGAVIAENSASGETLREIGRTAPSAGESITTTLDLGLQKKAYELLTNQKGVLIASIPATGEILALASSPAFDPSNVAASLNHPDLPLFDRAIGGSYPPGSTFKIITATAALEEGKINAEELIEDTGEIRIGSFRYGNWYFDQYGGKEGKLNIARAIARSNDIFFYQMGESLGIKHLADWSKYFGAGKITGIDFNGEISGLMPDEAWKLSYFKERWFLGDTFITAIGQGNILMTPLQVNQMLSVIAADGLWCKPHLIKDTPADCEKLSIDKANLAIVKAGLKQVAQPGGTAYPFFDFKVDGKTIAVAGKTGTSEFGDPEDKTHAWFTVMAPYSEPQITVTVLLEAAGEGSEKAAPLARDLLTYWFSRQK